MIEGLLKSDIFFVVTTVAVAGAGILVILILIYIVSIVRDINFISKKVKGGVKEITDDIKVVSRLVKKKDKVIERMINSFINKYKKR